MMIYKSVAVFIFFGLLCFFASYRSNFYLVNAHDARPGSSRKHARSVLRRITSKGVGTFYGYFASWGTWYYKLTNVHEALNVIAISFMKFDIEYNLDLAEIMNQPNLKAKTGLEYNGSLRNMMNETMELRKARPDLLILLSLGGATYQIKDREHALNTVPKIAHFIDATGLDGVDLDYEPNGAFHSLSQRDYAEFYVKYAKKFRENLCGDKLISISLSSNGAFSCVQSSGDPSICKGKPEIPYNSDAISQNAFGSDVQRLARIESAGSSHFLFDQLQNKIDIVFIQSYNAGSDEQNKTVLLDIYKSYLYYGIKYNYVIYLGLSITTPNVFRPDDDSLMDKALSLIKEENKKRNRGDGIGLWTLLVNERYVKEETFLTNFKNKLS